MATAMMLVCYSLALAILAFCYEYPDLAMLIALFAFARSILRRG